MRKLRVMLLPAGLVLPFFSRLLGGADRLFSYLGESPITAIIVMSLCNMIAWGPLFVFSFAFNRVGSFLIPGVSSFLYFGFRHYHLEMTSHESAVLEIIWIPVHTLVLIVLTGGGGYFLDKKMEESKNDG